MPSSLATVARNLVASNELLADSTATARQPSGNPFAKRFSPVVSPYLNSASMTGSSSTAWYLMANPSDVAAIEIAYLNGRRQPTIESGDTSFDTLGMQWRGYFDFGVAKQDYRAAVKNTGAE